MLAKAVQADAGSGTLILPCFILHCYYPYFLFYSDPSVLAFSSSSQHLHCGNSSSYGIASRRRLRQCGVQAMMAVLTSLGGRSMGLSPNPCSEPPLEHCTANPPLSALLWLSFHDINSDHSSSTTCRHPRPMKESVR